MAICKKAELVAVLACLGMASVACTASHVDSPGGAADAQSIATPPPTHAAIELYNDSRSPVHVFGCINCGSSGEALARRQWLPLNLPPNKIQLKIRQPTETTCLMIVNGVDTGKPLAVRVSQAAASAC